MRTKKPRVAPRGKSRSQHIYQERTATSMDDKTTRRNYLSPDLTIAQAAAFARESGSTLAEVAEEWGRQYPNGTITVPCPHVGCDNHDTGHEVDAFDPAAAAHRHSGLWEALEEGDVDCYWDESLGRWHASAYLTDNDGPLTADQVSAFTSAWFDAYEAAQRLNAAAHTEATC